jgi:hypothetical protein
MLEAQGGVILLEVGWGKNARTYLKDSIKQKELKS